MISTMFIPIQKVDAERREVWGYAAVEEPDNSDEIMDYASSRPYWIEWSQRAQKRSGGRSLGNLRAMHQNVAAGKLIDLRADDMRRGFYIGAKIVDDNEWKKVTQGVYTGFSVGGSYLKRWMDYRDQGKTRYTAKPTEVSIVDAPCIPSATFEVVKADGLVEIRHFRPTDGENVLKWEETKHPRANDGKFAPKGSGGGGGTEHPLGENSHYAPADPGDKPGDLRGIRIPIPAPEPSQKDPPQPTDDEGDDDVPYPRTAYDEKQGHTGRLQPANTNSGKGYFGMTDDAKRQATVRPDEKQPGAWYTHAMADGEKTVITHHPNEFEARRRAELHLANEGGVDYASYAAAQRRDAAQIAWERSLKNNNPKESDEDDWEDDDEILPEGEDQYADAKRQLDAKLDAARRHKYEPIRQHPAPEKQSSKRVSNPDKERMRQADKGHAHNMDVLSGNPEAVEREMQAREKQEREMRRRYGKVEGDKTLTKKFELFKELANEILDEIDTLEKADAPGAPEKLTDIQLESEVGESYEVEHMPEPVATLSLTESVGKSQEELAQSAVKTQDLSSILEAWLPKVGAMVKAEVANAILGLKKEESPAPAVRKVIVVRRDLTKGEKEN